MEGWVDLGYSAMHRPPHDLWITSPTPYHYTTEGLGLGQFFGTRVCVHRGQVWWWVKRYSCLCTYLRPTGRHLPYARFPRRLESPGFFFFKIPGPGKSRENCCHQMAYFNAKMHQIWFWLGLHPRPHAGGAHSTPPDPLAEFKGSYFQGNERERGEGPVGEGRVFSLYLSIFVLQKGPGKFLVGVLEKSLIFLTVKEWEPCI